MIFRAVKPKYSLFEFKKEESRVRLENDRHNVLDWLLLPNRSDKGESDLQYTHYEIEATLISNIFETGQNFRKIKQSTGVFFKKIEKISNNSNTYKQQWKALSNNDR